MNRLNRIKFTVKGWYYRLSYKASNLIYWLPKVYNLGDWDYYYFEKFTVFQLDRMILKFTDFNKFCGEHHTYDLNRMKLARELLNRVNSNYYVDELDKYYGADYDLDQRGLFTRTTTFDNLGEYFDKHPRAYKHVLYHLKRIGRKVTEDDRYLIGTLLSERLTDEARMLAYKIIAIHSPRWWF